MKKFDVRFNTFFRKGVPDVEDSWGVYMVTGFQGSGKTYFATYLLTQFINDYKIHTNVLSMHINGKEISYFKTLDEITDDTEENQIYVIDEISKRFTKTSLQDKKFYSWLQQSRKRGRIVILITQEWKEVPTWLRRPIRYMYTTRRLGLLPIYITSVGDALNCTFNTETNDWECPVLSYIVYKRNKFIADMYDTFEPVDIL